MMAESLIWSTQLQSAPGRSKRLHGDKITLPQSALEALLAAAPIVPVEDTVQRRHTPGFDPFNPYSFTAERYAREASASRQQELPHPLTFRLTNPQNGRMVYAGIREFSADDGTIGLSDFLRQALGLPENHTLDGRSSPAATNGDGMIIDDEKSQIQTVSVKAYALPKGTYVRLRPLEAGYDAQDWKSLLERYLRDNFTTLTNGEVLEIPGSRKEHFKFLIDKFEPEGSGICVVDTDLEVDIEALNEEQARETLKHRLQKAKQSPNDGTGTSTGGLLALSEQKHGQVSPGDYVDYELRSWDRSTDLTITVTVEKEDNVSVLVTPFSARQRARPRFDEHVFANFDSHPTKRLKLSHRNVDIEEAETIYISLHATQIPGEDVSIPAQYSLNVVNGSGTEPDEDDAVTAEPGADEVRCKNCQQIVPKRSLPLHEAFCYRNNVLCPKCNNVFLKNSEAWKTHWHCSHDEEYGNGQASHDRHDYIFHPGKTLPCPACDYEAYDIPTLAQHRTTTCPEKEILCQFCHLVVPQQGPDDPAFTDAEVLLSGLTPHEVTEGSRTTECHLCGKIVKLQNMKMHMKLHDRDRILKPKPKLCVNTICGRVIKTGKELQADREQLGLCDECFGPIHGTAYDPEGKALRRRIERRLLQQLMGGCGKSWCHNSDWCRTGRKNSTGQDMITTAKDALPIVKPILDQVSLGDSKGLRFCTDEASQSRRAMADMLAAEKLYDLEWCIKALEETRNDFEKARDWLKDMAPKKDEVIAPGT